MASGTTDRRLAVLVALVALAVSSPAPAVCPQDVCDCLGAASHFSLVSPEVAIKGAKLGGYGESYPVGSNVEGSVCATEGSMAGKIDSEASIFEDLMLTASSGTAVKFKGSRSYGFAYPGVFIDGDLGTAGGTIKGAEFGLVAGTTDTTNGNPRVGECANALAATQAASATLAALPASQSIPKLEVSGGSTYVIAAGAGVNVIGIGDLSIKPLKYNGYAVPSVLNIVLAEDTDSVIVNISGKVAIGESCEILVEGGDIEQVILNVTGTKPTVKMKKFAFVSPAILAPGRKLQGAANTSTANLYAAGIKLKGSQIAEPLLCP